MFRIGEFSKLVRVSPRMLRHYEKCGLLSPAKTDPATGYRQYSAAQIPLVMRIAALRDAGFSIDETCDILPRFEDKAYMDGVLRNKTAQVQAAIQAQNERLGLLENLRQKLTKEQDTMEYDVILKELSAVRVLSLRQTLADYSREGELWEKMAAFMGSHGVSPRGGEEGGYSLYHDSDYKETDVDVEIAVPVEAFGEAQGDFCYRMLDAVPLAATLRFAGPYEGTAAASERLAAWIEQNGYEMAGLMRGASIITSADQTDPQNFLTELQFPVQKV